MLPGFIEVTRDGVLYQVIDMGLLWPRLGLGVGLVGAVVGLLARLGVREVRPIVLSVLAGYAAFSAQAVFAAIAWMPLEQSFEESRHVGSLFSEAFWENLVAISFGTGLAAFGLATWALHRPASDPYRLPVGAGLAAALLASVGLSVPGHMWGSALAEVGYPPELSVPTVPKFHVGQTVTAHPQLGYHASRGLLFRRTVWAPLGELEQAQWTVPPLALSAPEPGTHAAAAQASRGIFTMRRDLEFEVGEDRGDPRFSPALGDRWTYARLGGYRGSLEALYAGEEALPPEVSTLTLEVTGERVVSGLRVLTLRRTDPDGEVLQRALYFMDGQTWVRVQGGEDLPALASDSWASETSDMPPPPPPPPPPPLAEPEELEEVEDSASPAREAAPAREAPPLREAPIASAGPEGLWACETPLLNERGCWCFEEGGPRQGVAYCSLDTTDHTPSLIRGVLAVLTVGITEITGATKGMTSTHTEAGLVLLPESASDP